MNLELAGKQALITGASQGIGFAIADSLAAEGCHLHLAGRSEHKLRAAAAQLAGKYPGTTIKIWPVDLARADAQQELAEGCADVDVLVNNAGGNPGGDLLNTDDKVWRDSWELKVFGYIALSRGVLLKMKARGSGVILNVIGNAGERLRSQYIIGTTGNAALMAFTCSVGSQSPDFGVRVLGVNPGLTATDRAERMLRGWSATRFADPERWREVEQMMDLPFGRMAAPQEIANVVTFLVSPLAAYVSGTIVTVDGGAVHRNG